MGVLRRAPAARCIASTARRRLPGQLDRRRRRHRPRRRARHHQRRHEHRGTGRAYLYSGRTGACCTCGRARAARRLRSRGPSAGDMNLDGYRRRGSSARGDRRKRRRRVHLLRPHLRAAAPARRRASPAPGWPRAEGSPGPRQLIVGGDGLPGGAARTFAGFRRSGSRSRRRRARVAFGTFFVAGVGRVDGDLFPDFYVARLRRHGGNGWAGVYLRPRRLADLGLAGRSRRRARAGSRGG